MKVFWSDREGNSPPPDAQFGMVPFLEKAPIYSKNRELITTLPSPSSYKIKNHHFLPEKKDWLKNVGLEEGVEKVVLARCHVLELYEKPDPFKIVAHLQKKKEGAFLFCFADVKSAFLGATPERLFRRDEDTIQTEALAGTFKRGEKITSSSKEEREWLFVENYLKTSLHPFVQSPLQFSEKTLHTTHNLHHFYSRGKGTLLPGITDEKLIEILHPTPALCGTPKEKAFKQIEKEPFSRGMYGGLLGWKTDTSSEWVVGIRSCFIEENFVYLYVGAGIVEGSDPEKEWEELIQKEKLYEGIFLSH